MNHMSKKSRCNHHRMMHRLAFTGFDKTAIIWCTQNGGHSVEVTPEMVKEYEKSMQVRTGEERQWQGRKEVVRK